MSSDRSSDPLVTASVGSAALEGLDVPQGDIDLAKAFAADELDGEEYVAEVRRRIAEDVPATRT